MASLDITNELDNDLLEPSKIIKIADLEDGSSVYDTQDLEEVQEESEIDFNENLADLLSSSELSVVSSQLLEGIEQDIDSRKDWEASYVKGLSYLGIKLEEFKNVPFVQACRAFDTTLSMSLLRFYATARAELFPQKGPVDIDILGQPNDFLYEKADKVKKWLNYYLTDVDKEYYPDSERLLMYVGLVGCSFRKAYIDPILDRPVLRFIDPQNFIVNNDCVTLLSSDRITHVLYLSKTDIKLRQESGFYSDISLPELDNSSPEDDSPTDKKVRSLEGIDTDAYDKRSLYKIYEVHANILLRGDPFSDEKPDVPLPYIVTISPENRKILSIRRNWEEKDKSFRKIQYFVQHNYLPGFGVYGLGLANLLGSNAVALTSILRQLIDKGTLSNFPAGLMVAGMRIEENDKGLSPGEFRSIETGGLPIQSAVMTMPYGEPSLVLKELRNELLQQTQQLSSTAEVGISENNREMPVGTTLALLEVNNKIQGAVFRSLHVSLTNELQLLYELFRKNFPEETYTFDISNEKIDISKSDFLSNIKILPKADPEVSTAIQRIVKNESILKIASTAPQLHDMRQVYALVYKALNVDDIDVILPQKQQAVPLNPLTENMNIMTGKPVISALWQEHDAHIMVHSTSPAGKTPEGMAHIQEHMAQKYLLAMQLQMGFALPPLEQIQDPQIQNQIAMAAAQAAQQMNAQQQQQNPPPLDPNQVMMADIQQRKEASMLKAQEAKLKAETEAFKAQMSFESEKNKMENQKEIAQAKNETDLEVEHLKHEERKWIP